MNKPKLRLEVVGYEESEDAFHLQQVDGNEEETTVDLDTFTMPSFVVACLVGEYGEPHEFVGKVIEIPTP